MNETKEKAVRARAADGVLWFQAGVTPRDVVAVLDERDAARSALKIAIAERDAARADLANVTRADVVLAASRGVYSAAVTHPTAHLGEAAREFVYQARTATGDAFETAHEWARENEQARRDMGDGARTAIERERDALRADVMRLTHVLDELR